jgi:DNA-binding transcriptional ArsR family regulator
MDRVYRALADPTRRKIIALLRDRDMTAGEIAEHFTVSKPTLSGHFAVLREAALIQPSKSGTTITYRLNLSVLEDAMALLLDAFRLGEVRRSKRPKRPRSAMVSS